MHNLRHKRSLQGAETSPSACLAPASPFPMAPQPDDVPLGARQPGRACLGLTRIVPAHEQDQLKFPSGCRLANPLVADLPPLSGMELTSFRHGDTSFLPVSVF